MKTLEHNHIARITLLGANLFGVMLVATSILTLVGILAAVIQPPSSFIALMDAYSYEGYYEKNRAMLLGSTTYNGFSAMPVVTVLSLVELVAGISLLVKRKTLFYFFGGILIARIVSDVLVNNAPLLSYIRIVKCSGVACSFYMFSNIRRYLQ